MRLTGILLAIRVCTARAATQGSGPPYRLGCVRCV